MAKRGTIDDFKAKVTLKNHVEKALIHDYLDSLVDGSPFNVGSINPTYSKLFWICWRLTMPPIKEKQSQHSCDLVQPV